MNNINSQILTSVWQALSSIWYLIPVFLIITFFKSRFFKGKLGESVVNFSITKKLDKDTYHLIKDITLPSVRGTTQIDHILVSKYGIFVIETKNFKGWIFGSKTQRKWTQQIYKHKKTFQNPLHQNYKHIKTLSELLNIEESKFHSLIVFTGESKFKTKMPENVLKKGYTKYIKSKNIVLFSETEVYEILNQIESKQFERGFKTNREHVKNLKKTYNEVGSSKNSCPKCGSLLVERVARKGVNAGNTFLGCSNFPRCRFIKN
ncbi:MAG TPA: nuclease [Oceanospirillales bacterium]|nr:nuclease [Oceanospirillales bacterium]